MMVDLLERIDVMLDQEQQVYNTLDYLADSFQKKLVSLDVHGRSVSPSSSTDLSTVASGSSSSSTINEIWREKICEWSYQVSTNTIICSVEAVPPSAFRFFLDPRSS